MRRMREKSGLSLSVVAGKMGYSKAYLSDMELGRRGFGATQIRKFKSALT